MIVVRDREEARWLPSRSRYALFRLYSLLRLRAATPVRRPGLIFAIDRNQNQAEYYLGSIWICTTVTIYVAALLGLFLVAPVAIVIAIAIAHVLIELPMYLLGIFVTPSMTSEKIQSIWLFVWLTVLSSYIATLQSPARWAAYFYFVVLASNALAAVVMFALRGRVAAIEREYYA